MNLKKKIEEKKKDALKTYCMPCNKNKNCGYGKDASCPDYSFFMNSIVKPLTDGYIDIVKDVIEELRPLEPYFYNPPETVGQDHHNDTANKQLKALQRYNNTSKELLGDL